MSPRFRARMIRKGCGIGCLALLVVFIALAGGATWYAGRINKEYKAVERSEEALRAAVGPVAFTPPAEGRLDPARLDAFLAVRDALEELRPATEAAGSTFARERFENRGRGPRGWWNMLGAGADLAPVYAEYWSLRNRSLLAQEMGPEEYAWIYELVYWAWLAKDPGEGSEAGAPAPATYGLRRTVLPTATVDLLAPHRLRLEAGYSKQLNPIELIFSVAE